MRDKPVILVQLIHIQGPLKGEIQEAAQDSILIGRHPSCQVQFPRDLSVVSRMHAEIIREGNRFKLIDKSTNGTFVNGKKVEEAYLKDGDVLMFSEGGPKASFLTKVLEDQPEAGIMDAAPVERPSPPAQAPVSASPPQAMDQTPAAPPQPPVMTPHEPPQASPVKMPIEKIKKPLIVQYGPTLNSYRELPVTIGSAPGNDMVLTHPAISDRHAQIFFSQNKYWIKDLTGENIVSINGAPISLQAPLNPNDILALSPQGPRFTFLGEGRLAEIEEPAQEQPRPMPEKQGNAPQSEGDVERKPKGIGALYKDIFKR